MGQHQTVEALPENIPDLVTQLCVGSLSRKKKGAAALATLSESSTNQRTILNYGGISPLVVLLRDGTKSQKTEAALALSRLSKNDEIKDEIAAIGGIPPLVSLMRTGKRSQRDIAISTLLNLAKNLLAQLATNPENYNAILKARAINPLVRAVGNGTELRKTYAMTAMQALTEDDKCKAAIVVVEMAEAGCIPLLVALMRDDFNIRRESAACVLSRLTLDPENIEAIAVAGAIEQFVALVQDGNTFEKEYAVHALAKLSLTDSNNRVVESAGGIPLLIVLVRSGTIVQSDFAAKVLSNLSANERLRDVIRRTRRGLQ
ncbi:Leucine-rich repeat serine/threonine-protein kinase 2 [Phytophthora pseudosyringae]|uniref:Leucine-rich repeat serine/threonine-protein kinase 2 n=1 Tax=Phytophthora pseudosyringae TaxID=221518 RepID=A0A8T1VNX5_9STRA|nr:Leucine-rich repeat serine/threonine-protein kinase 2 [Phytophthora pseudosyringae]